MNNVEKYTFITMKKCVILHFLHGIVANTYCDISQSTIKQLFDKARNLKITNSKVCHLIFSKTKVSNL